MKETTISGASDDIISIDGQIEEEFYVNCDSVNYVSLSDGTVIEVKYDGIWRLSPVAVGDLFLRIICGTDEDTDYTDKAFFEPGIEWAVCGKGAGKLTPKKVVIF